MNYGKTTGVAKVLLCESGAPAPSLKHAGMGIVVCPCHVLTRAHVVNTATNRTQETDTWPDRPIRVVFPHSENDDTSEGKVTPGTRWATNSSETSP
jgi:hypothetical protein